MAFIGRLVTTLLALLFLSPNVLIYADSLSEIILTVPQDSLTPAIGIVQQDSTATTVDTPQQESSLKIDNSENNELTNIVVTTKKIRAYGWGEYEVGGRCLCCDNMLDGDCIIVHNTNRTEKKPVKQIVDGKIEADTSDETTYFGDLEERERAEHVTQLMAEITLNKQRDIYKIVVYTMVGKEKRSSFLSNCEINYFDQFDRLQLAGKADNKKGDTNITFNFKKPVFTSSLLFKVNGGTNRITEIAIFCKKSKE